MQEHLETRIAAMCAEGPSAANYARLARNNLSLVLSKAGNLHALVDRVAEMVQERYGVSSADAEGRSGGFLQDFIDLIPKDCGD